MTNRKYATKQSLPSVPPYHNTERGIGTVQQTKPKQTKQNQKFHFII